MGLKQETTGAGNPRLNASATTAGLDLKSRQGERGREGGNIKWKGQKRTSNKNKGPQNADSLSVKKREKQNIKVVWELSLDILGLIFLTRSFGVFLFYP